MKPFVIAVGLAAISLGAVACSPRDTTAPEPQGESVGAAMPDTSQSVVSPGAPGSMAAPDAGATGVVPADGSPPPVQPDPAPAAPR